MRPLSIRNVQPGSRTDSPMRRRRSHRKRNRQRLAAHARRLKRRIQGPPVHAGGVTLSEAAVCIGLSGKPPVRAHSNEVNIQTLVSPTIFRQAVAPVALEVFEVYSPTFFMRIVGCKVVLSTRRPLADFSNVVADLKGQNVYVMGIERGVSIY